MPIAQDLAGRRFGRLVATSRLPRRYWACQCDCGKPVTIRGDHLTSGATNSCGCIRDADDLTGKQFGYWRVLERVGSNEYKTPMWRCVCECGVEGVLQSSNLKWSGDKQSCGCGIEVEDLSGQRFGRLTISARIFGKPTRVICKCDCGNDHTAFWSNIKQGRTTSCGCASREAVRLTTFKSTHGKSRDRAYRIWSSMKQRCSNEKVVNSHRYLGRGITVCQEWQHSFAAFYADMGDPPTARHTLDRRLNHLGYSKSNCRWATPKEQGRNRDVCRYIEAYGSKRCLSEWGELIGLPGQTIAARLRRGWTIERAITTPSSRKPKEECDAAPIHA